VYRHLALHPVRALDLHGALGVGDGVVLYVHDGLALAAAVTT
jgi:hypothetical protein